MKRLSCFAASIALLMAASMQAHAVVDEIVAAYCSGGGVGVIGADGLLRPPGISNPFKSNFAAPVVATGAVEIVPIAPGPPPTFDVFIGDVPSAKYPVGILVVSVVDGVPQPGPGIAGLSDHPSAANCHNMP